MSGFGLGNNFGLSLGSEDVRFTSQAAAVGDFTSHVTPANSRGSAAAIQNPENSYTRSGGSSPTAKALLAGLEN